MTMMGEQAATQLQDTLLYALYTKGYMKNDAIMYACTTLDMEWGDVEAAYQEIYNILTY